MRIITHFVSSCPQSPFPQLDFLVYYYNCSLANTLDSFAPSPCVKLLWQSHNGLNPDIRLLYACIQTTEHSWRKTSSYANRSHVNNWWSILDGPDLDRWQAVLHGKPTLKVWKGLWPWRLASGDVAMRILSCCPSVRHSPFESTPKHTYWCICIQM